LASLDLLFCYCLGLLCVYGYDIIVILFVGLLLRFALVWVFVVLILYFVDVVVYVVLWVFVFSVWVTLMFVLFSVVF